MDIDFEIRHIFNLMIRRCPMNLGDVTVQKNVKCATNGVPPKRGPCCRFVHIFLNRSETARVMRDFTTSLIRACTFSKTVLLLLLLW